VSLGLQIDKFDVAIAQYDWDFLAVDFEKTHNQHHDGGFSRMCKTMIDTFIDRYNKPVLLYTGPSIIMEWMLPFGENWYQTYDLWIAQYPYNEAVYGPQSALLDVPRQAERSWNPWLPAGSTNWKIWQYSADGNKRAAEFGATGNSNIDLDVFNGTSQDMRDWCKKEVSVPVPPIEVPLPDPDLEARVTYLEHLVDNINEDLSLTQEDLTKLEKKFSLSIGVQDTINADAKEARGAIWTQLKKMGTRLLSLEGKAHTHKWPYGRYE